MTPQEIKQARKKLGLKQRELAELLGVTTKSVGCWEAGIQNISQPTARLLRLLAG